MLVILIHCCFALFWTQHEVQASPALFKLAPRIIGGSEAVSRQFPFMVAIHVQTADAKFFCGGGFLNWVWIITSANCVYNSQLLTIQLGSILLEGEDADRVTVTSSEYYVYPDFRPESLEHDIGLIYLNTSVNMTSDSTLSNTLKYVNGTIMPIAECRLIYGSAVTDNMVCFQATGNEGTCIGDNGTPLLVNYLGINWVTAVASFVSGNGCESTDPSGYTQVLPYMEWIRNVTGIYYIIL